MTIKTLYVCDGVRFTSLEKAEEYKQLNIKCGVLDESTPITTEQTED